MIDTQTWLILGTIVLSAMAVALYARQLIIRAVITVWKAIEETAEEAARNALPRLPLPVISHEPIKPGEMKTIKSSPIVSPFKPERVFVSNYDRGPSDHGAAHWIVNDIRVDGKTQFSQAGDVPGDMFATNAIDGFVQFQIATESIEVDVTYIGADQKGMPFYGSLMGRVHPIASSGTTVQPTHDIHLSGGRPTLFAGRVANPATSARPPT
jgi:hypothetical protein